MACLKQDKLLKALDDQCISTEPQRYTFTERLLTGDAKASFNQAVLDIGTHKVDNFRYSHKHKNHETM